MEKTRRKSDGSGASREGARADSATPPAAEQRRQRKKAKKEKASEVAKKAPSAAALKRKAKLPVIAPGANPYLNPNRPVAAGKVVVQNEDDFLNNILGDLDVDIVPEVAKVEPRRAPAAPRPMKKRVAASAVPQLGKLKLDGSSSDSFSDATELFGARNVGPSSDGMMAAANDPEDLGGMDSMDFDDFNDFGGGGDDDTVMAESALKAEEADDDDEEIFIKPSLPSTSKPKVRRQLVNGAGVQPIPPTPKDEQVDLVLPPAALHPAPSTANVKPKGMDWRTATAKLAAAPAPAYVPTPEEIEEAENTLPTPDSLLKKTGKKVVPAPIVLGNIGALEDDGSLRFWWFDYIEGGPGTLYLIGKVKAKGGKEDGKWVSATVTVTGIKRRLQVLPRAKALDSAFALPFRLGL